MSAFTLSLLTRSYNFRYSIENFSAPPNFRINESANWSRSGRVCLDLKICESAAVMSGCSAIVYHGVRFYTPMIGHPKFTAIALTRLHWVLIVTEFFRAFGTRR